MRSGTHRHRWDCMIDRNARTSYLCISERETGQILLHQLLGLKKREPEDRANGECFSDGQVRMTGQPLGLTVDESNSIVSRPSRVPRGGVCTQPIRVAETSATGSFPHPGRGARGGGTGRRAVLDSPPQCSAGSCVQGNRRGPACSDGSEDRGPDTGTFQELLSTIQQGKKDAGGPYRGGPRSALGS